MSKVVVVVGTRPEAIKTVFVVSELRKLGVEVDVCYTGQHRSSVILGAMLDFGDVGRAFLHDVNGPCSGRDGHPALSLMDCMLAISRGCHHRTSAVLVQGDTRSAMAGALVAFERNTPLIHLEAGMRSGHVEPRPEEQYRRSIDAMSSLWLCSRRVDLLNLLSEGLGAHDAVARAIDIGATSLDPWSYLRGVAPGQLVPAGYILVSIHRAENRSREAVERAMRLALASREAGERVLWVGHVSSSCASPWENRSLAEQMEILEPQSPLSMSNLVRRASLVLTDSGGLEEECCFGKVPCVILRRSSERRNYDRIALDGESLTDAAIPSVGHALSQNRYTLGPRRGPAGEYGLPGASVRAAAAIAELIQ